MSTVNVDVLSKAYQEATDEILESVAGLQELTVEELEQVSGGGGAFEVSHQLS